MHSSFNSRIKTGVYGGQKATQFFQLLVGKKNKICGTGRRRQTVSGLEVDFVEPLIKKGQQCSMCGPVLKVRAK